MALFGANKRFNILRLNKATGVYTQVLSNILARYEERDHSHKSAKEYADPQNHLMYTMMVHPIDIRETDRVECISDGKLFVVGGVTTLDDVFGKHHEVFMREIVGVTYETVIRRVLQPKLNQVNFDPLFREYEKPGGKLYTDETLQVVIKDHREFVERYRMQTEGGKIMDLDYIMYVEINQEMTTDDRIVYEGEEYMIKWITNEVYEKAIGIKLDMHSVPTEI